MSNDELIQQLEAYWDTDGFLYSVRHGDFQPRDGDAFLDLIRGISIGEDELIPKRLVSLLWYLPLFLEWQKERVAELSPTHVSGYERFANDVRDAVQEVLGVP